MFALQKNLPRLKVPQLAKSLKDYLNALEPLAVNGLQNTKQIVAEFEKEQGQFLQSKLREKAASNEEWFKEFYENFFYFENQDSVLTTSVAVHFTTEHFSDEQDQLWYTTTLIRRIAQYHEAVRNETLPVQYTRHGEALCMRQFPKLLSTCRVPHVDRDYLFQHDGSSQHVVIAHNDHFFKLPVYEGNKLCDVTTLMKQLIDIVNDSTKATPVSVGILTTLKRDAWAETYNVLIQNTTNARNIDCIKKAICLISLDQTPIKKQQQIGFNQHEKDQKLFKYEVKSHHGDIFQGADDTCNRWFDKTSQFVVNGNGVVGFCLEHSSVDGSTVEQMTTSLCDIEWKKRDRQIIPTTKTTTSLGAAKLSWILDDRMREKIRLAKNQLNKNELEIREFCFNEFGKAAVKRLAVSPDAFFQVAIQLAYYRLHKRHVSTGEAVHLRRFAHGRIENFPVATSEICLFARTMDREDISNKNKQQILERAISRHIEISHEAAKGSHEMHLLSLDLMSKELGIPTPHIFADSSYMVHCNNIISTSQISSVKKGTAIFAPYAREGYCVFYNIMPHQFVYVVSSYNTYRNTNAGRLGEMIGQALNDILLLINTRMDQNDDKQSVLQ